MTSASLSAAPWRLCLRRKNSCHPVEMFGVERVPSRDMLLLLSRHNVKKRWTNDRVQSLRLQTDPLSIRNSPYLPVSKGKGR